MAGAPFWRRILDGVLSIGSYPGEPETQAGGRRVLVAALVVGTLLNVPTVISDFNAGYTLVAASVVYAVVIPSLMDPIYEVPDPTADAAFNLVATGVLVLAVLAYFAHQRDRFQRRSDHLLHNILPNEIADRLKDGRAMIADDFAAASVLFADVVNFAV